MPQPEPFDLEELRKTYFPILSRPLVRRAKGIPYGRISGPGALIVASTLIILPIALVVYQPFLASISLDQFRWYVTLFFVLVFSVFLYLPQYFYDERKRTRRWVKRRYPHVYRTLKLLEQREQDEFVASGYPALNIENRKYFLGVYICQRKWDVRRRTSITGYAVVDATGRVVTDAEIFRKAFSTYDAGLVGAVCMQNLDTQERRTIQEYLKYYLRRAEKILRSQRRAFEEMGSLNEWQELLDRLPALHASGRDALTIYDGRENFRRAIGYSFGYEYFHEDATFEKEMNRAFSAFMAVAHQEQMDRLRLLATHLYKAVEEGGSRVMNAALKYALKQILNFSGVVSSLIERMAVEGVAVDEHLALFHIKLSYARSLPVPLDQPDEPVAS